MASLNQVSIELKVTGERQATKALNDFANAGKQVGSTVGQVGRKISSIEGEWKSLTAANRRNVLDAKALESAKRKLAKQLSDLTGQTEREAKATLTSIKNSEARAIADKQAALAAQELAKQKKLQQAINQREIQSYNQLRSVIDQSYASRMRLKQAADTLRAAERQGLITREQAIEQLRRYRDAAQQAAAGGGFMGRNVSRAGVLTQQAGYQVGDFIVQVQGGTNAFVAFGQQATQIAGTLTLLGGKWVLLGSVLGVAIPLLTAVGAAFMRTREATDEAAEGVETLDGRLKSLDSTLNEWVRTRKAAEMGITVNELLSVDSIREAEEALKEAQRAYDDLFDTISGNIISGFDIFGLIPENRRRAFEQAEKDLIEAEERLAQISAMQRQKSREEAEEAMNEAWEEQKREQALAEYEAGQAAIAERKAWVEEATQIFRDAQKRMRDEEIAETEKSLQQLFRNRTIMYSIRFSDEETVMSQDVIQPPKAPAMPSYSELLGMGWTKENIEAMGVSAPRSSGGGGGGSRGPDPVEELNRAQKAVDQLRASYDEQFATSLKVAEAQEKINELIRLNPDLTDQANQVLQDYIASLEQAKNPMEDFANNSAKQMADAFVSIIDGSKSASDAFKDMARSILEQALRMAVINPIINSIFGGVGGFNPLPTFFANANGNAFNNGNVIPFANGGVVSSPTMFPMAGSQTGLMGEAGPEAIMPLKRGKGGKLGVVAEGGQQPVVINQSFNFSANGDESVKRIIAQEAPRIANLTQKQIIDQRRRGGTMKAAFG